jgi:hypothetical protein
MNIGPPASEVDTDEDVDGASASAVSGTDDLIDIDITYAWQPRYPGTMFVSSLKTRAQDMTAVIADLTGCTVLVGENYKEVIIKGHGSEIVEIASAKLDNLERDYVRDSLGRRMIKTC